MLTDGHGPLQPIPVAARALLLVLAITVPVPVCAGLEIFTCEPEWAALADEIGGDRVTVSSATTAWQDPHHIQARPSLIAKARRADLIVCSGAELEAGWLPLLLRKSGNSAVQAGTPGLLLAAEAVELKGATESVDRSRGDVHAAGNPHVHTSPQHLLQVAVVLAQRMQRLDTDGREHYQRGLETFSQRWQQAMQRWQRSADAVRGKRIITHHSFWLYLADWLGLTTVAQLEPLPGVQPGVAHLSKLQQQYSDGADMIVRVNYSDARAAEWLAQRTGLPVVELPSSVDYQGGQTLFEWFDQVIQRLAP